MVIHELAQQTGVSAKTIRYYESIGLLPPPQRGSNNYRQYQPADVEHVRFLSSARALGFSLRDIASIHALRDDGVAPCNHVLTTLAQRLAEVDRRIAETLALKDTLVHLYDTGSALPRDDVAGRHCVCALLKTHRPKHQPRRNEGDESCD